jgi:hypothetical protein
MNGNFGLNHLGEEPGAWPSSEFSVRAALLLLAAGLVVCRLPIALILLRLTGLLSIRCRRLLGFIAHYIIPFGKDLKQFLGTCLRWSFVSTNSRSNKINKPNNIAPLC